MAKSERTESNSGRPHLKPDNSRSSARLAGQRPGPNYSAARLILSEALLGKGDAEAALVEIEQE